MWSNAPQNEQVELGQECSSWAVHSSAEEVAAQCPATESITLPGNGFAAVECTTVCSRLYTLLDQLKIQQGWWPNLPRDAEGERKCVDMSLTKNCGHTVKPCDSPADSNAQAMCSPPDKPGTACGDSDKAHWYDCTCSSACKEGYVKLEGSDACTKKEEPAQQ